MHFFHITISEPEIKSFYFSIEDETDFRKDTKHFTEDKILDTKHFYHDFRHQGDKFKILEMIQIGFGRNLHN